ncbi:hypothetical protein BV25DRAFT_1455167 [Artomyces pyxidatus]|uniref:Uncharacterized protein n=1 Tax=Artomyces pyxidatus TaxID=48021 RepID=A0ACB8SN80_9AGAM|nr:hypothetical protein BV25DRAFT_1455167 [Artomyces pyxidatus]
MRNPRIFSCVRMHHQAIWRTLQLRCRPHLAPSSAVACQPVPAPGSMQPVADHSTKILRPFRVDSMRPRRHWAHTTGPDETETLKKKLRRALTATFTRPPAPRRRGAGLLTALLR